MQVNRKVPFCACRQMREAVEQGFCNDGFEGVELELAPFGGHRDGDIVPDHLIGDLIDELRDDRIDFAGHDRRTSLAGREVDFAETGLGARRQ